MAGFDYTVARRVIEGGGQPVSGPRFYWRALWLRVNVLFVAIHWTADPNVEAKTDTIAKAIAYLRSIHTSYLRSRGYSVGYSVAIDQDGHSYELRGTTFRPAATLGRLLTRQRLSRLLDPEIGLFRHLIPDAARQGNRHTVAGLFLCGEGGPSRAAQIEAARFVDWCERESGRRLECRGHSFFDPTGCPGDVARDLLGDDGPTDPFRRLIETKAWDPIVPPPTPNPPIPIHDIDPEEADVYFISHPNHGATWACNPGAAARVADDVLEAKFADGVPHIVTDDEEQIAWCERMSGRKRLEAGETPLARPKRVGVYRSPGAVAEFV